MEVVCKRVHWALEICPSRWPFHSCQSHKNRHAALRKVGTGPSIFYSFGAKTPEARGFRDSLSPQGNSFNDLLPSGWFVGHRSVGEAVNLLRQALLVARFSQAMAELSRGEKFLIVTPDINPYTIPKDTFDIMPNVWRQYAFPTIQRNSAIMQVTTVINAAPYERQTGWLPNNPQCLVLQPSNADSQVSSLFLPANVMIILKFFTPPVPMTCRF